MDGLGDPTNKIQACKKPADDYTLNAENLNFTSTAPTTNIRIHTKYQYQVTTDAVSTSTLTYALKDAPAGITISTSGLVQWNPGREEDIKKHSSIKLQISSSNGSLKEQVFSVGVEGSCSREFRLWEGDQRSSVNASKELSSLYVYSDSASNPKNPVQNYNYGGSARHSANITHGKQPVEDKGVFFLYQEHDKTDRFYLFMILNKRGGTDSTSDGGVGGLKLKWDLFVSGNELQDSVQVSDDSGEVERSNQSYSYSKYTSKYKARFSYNYSKSDGGVIGPFKGNDLKVYVSWDGESTIDGEALSIGESGKELRGVDFYYKDDSGSELSTPLKEKTGFTIGTVRVCK